MDYKANGLKLGGKPKKTWREVVEKDRRQPIKEEVIQHNRWRKLLNDSYKDTKTGK